MQHVFDECFTFSRGDLVVVDEYDQNNLKIGIIISDFVDPGMGTVSNKKHPAYAKVFIDGSIKVYAKFTLKHI